MHARLSIPLRVATPQESLSYVLRTYPFTKALRLSFDDLQEATEFGACGVAILALVRCFGVRVAARSFKQTGFDYHLIPPGDSSEIDPDDIFGNTWALEVSGILRGSNADVDARVAAKRRQVAEATKLRTTLVAVIEFSEPSAVLVEVE